MIISNTRRRAAPTGDEVDVHSRFRHMLTCYQRAGKARAVKTRTNRRERREARNEIRRGTE